MEIFSINEQNKHSFDKILSELLGDDYKSGGLEAFDCYGLMDDDEFCGLTAISETDGLASLESLYVMPHLRNIRYGKELLETAEIAAVSRGYQDLSLVMFQDITTGDNQYGYPGSIARGFFEHFGYMFTESILQEEDPADRVLILQGHKHL